MSACERSWVIAQAARRALERDRSDPVDVGSLNSVFSLLYGFAAHGFLGCQIQRDGEALRSALNRRQDYQSLLRDANAAEAKRAFLHIARAGVPMAQEDFDQALAWAEPSGALTP